MMKVISVPSAVTKRKDKTVGRNYIHSTPMGIVGVRSIPAMRDDGYTSENCGGVPP